LRAVTERISIAGHHHKEGSNMTAREFRPTLKTLEDRSMPPAFSFTDALGGGHSAISVLIEVQPSPPANRTQVGHDQSGFAQRRHP
jgi:hypothetical protein